MIYPPIGIITLRLVKCWTPRFLLWTRNFGWTPSLNYTTPGPHWWAYDASPDQLLSQRRRGHHRLPPTTSTTRPIASYLRIQYNNWLRHCMLHICLEILCTPLSVTGDLRWRNSVELHT